MILMAGKIGMKICSEQGGLFLLNRVKKAKTKNVKNVKNKNPLILIFFIMILSIIQI